MFGLEQKLPDLTLDAYHEGEIKKVRLADYRGKWVVLIFYPADFTFVCPTELEAAAEQHEEFGKSGAEIMSVSTDSAYVHKAWHDHSPSIKKIKFPMLADHTAELCKTLGTYDEKEGVTVRASFIIDPDGVVKVLEMHTNSVGRNVAELLRKLQAAKFVRENNGYVCPANWKPGSKALKPGVDLVGKI